MKIAIPVTAGKLSPHFGHCEEFAVIDVDLESKSAGEESRIPAPPHEPGLLPQWLAEQDVSLVIAGGMGGRARDLFKQQKIAVLIGAEIVEPALLVQSFLDGSLQDGENFCDH
ncbi:MAG: NifB/NifX family molybdenum-iron cluster-binding protein [Candidatus Eisenbacteria bacterium]|uniref:NifB/NifX family molybdenum-iron cluster-binding protein n=1 Tax=Eiseniibacteriota bacterium TaxID=2212470 RepID=A0A948S1N2_UNCEI|nr:NifB/NifX family molybdenum-iron cluster-binding protein [Candidatus Eisenbacteria bacterium]MBU1947802.1 NifB/NifX family molybdenum-iron cluster-binding protein [Candidatus Eisenbacteria bacterium]MBU2693252.1 NifB/NifX family molybdenum-iron cluster-binding protein [Candidatus Eisenbacteria bacterium]